ncbi:TetR family transcriptional regulator [Ruminiclostridium sufflavum DSM 19573]|uniref:TetR family transcriptional regulator n=1 Tax=Ruminiclostridium sufflavum DSM 19573 TaxID=1121337 RepID=A0A318XVQ4_9FIRM|nr:TetR/AcrR family transcriptional regulator [Ruminiclostridium sufflavum]PYG86897.1 TetR family transcriptional regulator [Ruminiclostridium sufflavum DSM 19573]
MGTEIQNMNEMENMKQSKKILTAAFKCISSKGYANVSLRNIADEAGVVLSQLNYYYKNKEGLFIEVVKMLKKQYISEIENVLMKGESEKERIAFLIEYFQKVMRKDSELFRILFDLTSMSLWSAPLKELLNSLVNNITALIEKYVFNSFQSREKSKSYSTATLSRIIFGALFGTSAQAILANGDKDVIDSLSAIEMLLN